MNELLNKKLKQVAEQIGMEITDEELALAEQTLSDSQIKEISDSLESHRSESSKNLLLLPSNNGGKFTEEYNKYIQELKSECEGKEFKAVVTLNENGLENISMVKEIDENESIPEHTLSIKEIFENQIAVNKPKVLEGIKTDMDIDDESASVLLEIMTTDFEKENVYDKLPESIQNIIKNNIPVPDRTAKVLNQFAIFMINELKKSLIMEQQIIDLNESVKKEMEMSGLSGEIIDENDKYTYAKFEEVKQKALSLGMKSKVAEIDRTIEAYRQSHTFEFIKKVKTFSVGKKKFTKKQFLNQQLKYINQYCTQFNNRYKNHKFAINDVKSIIVILRKIMPELHLDDIHKFVIMFCMYCRTLKVDKPEDHVLMYYTIKNIIFLYEIKSPEDSEFYKEITTNLKEIIKYINE